MRGLFYITMVAGLLVSPAIHAAESDVLAGDQASQLKKILSTRKCLCRCDRFLPGSSRKPACFGCSVGKAEVSRVIGLLAAGRTLGQIAIELDDPVIIDVYADYDDPELSEVWDLVRRAGKTLGANRVVLRPLARTDLERNAVAFVEYARENGKFFEAHAALIEHAGPWDGATLVGLAERLGLSARDAARFMRKADVSAQINKNREHARLDGVRDMPAIYVNGTPVARDAEALRKAIRDVMVDNTM